MTQKNQIKVKTILEHKYAVLEAVISHLGLRFLKESLELANSTDNSI